MLVAVGGPLAAWIYHNWPTDIYDGVDYSTFVNVGAVDPKQATHVASLLDSHRIPNIVEGSVVYGISVPPDKAKNAATILSRDAESFGYWFQGEDRR